MPRLNPNAPKPHVLLQRALRLFGPTGKRWTKGAYQRDPSKRYPKGAFCAYGAVNKVNTKNASLARQYLVAALPPKNIGVIGFNDTRSRTFPQIKQLFKDAIALAKKAGH